MMIKTIFLRGAALLLLLPFFSTSQSLAQEIQFPDYKGYTIVKEYPVYTSDNLWDYINGAAESYMSLGFQELSIAEYKRGKKITVKAEVYSHLNPNMSFGIYALERAPSYNFIDIGIQGYRDSDMVHFIKGTYYVKVTTHSKSKKSIEAVYEIARLVENSLEGSTEMPQAIALFPDEGRQPNEEMYYSESALGHQFLQRAFRCSYISDNRHFDIYLFNEMNEQDNFEMLKEYLAKYGLDPGSGNSGKVMFEDGYNGTIFMAWSKGITVLVTGLKSDDSEIANRYIDQILE
jgi:hypothetical protein